jgi:hypothetical protein
VVGSSVVVVGGATVVVTRVVGNAVVGCTRVVAGALVVVTMVVLAVATTVEARTLATTVDVVGAEVIGPVRGLADVQLTSELAKQIRRTL